MLIRLPPGPTIEPTSPAVNGAFPDLLHGLPPSTWLVTINYRLGPDPNPSKGTHYFPIPVHDVSTAFEYLTSSNSPFNENQDSEPKICLLGSHIGGALATMLALTRPNDIHAIAVLEPMVDWIGLDQVVEELQRTDSSLPIASRKRQKQKATLTRYGTDTRSVLSAAQEIIKLRGKLFKTPSAYFDPFASPLLFLRAPGRDTPLGSTVGDQLVSEMGSDEGDGEHGDYDAFGPSDEHWPRAGPSPTTAVSKSESEFQASPSPTMAATAESSTPPRNAAEDTTESMFVSDESPPTPSPTDPPRPPRRRKVLRRWPSVGRPESVMLPYVQVFVQAQSESNGPPAPIPRSDAPPATDTNKGLSALMRAQGTELAELMRRACFYGREKGFAEERVLLCEQGHRGAGRVGARAPESPHLDPGSPDSSGPWKGDGEPATQTIMWEKAVRWAGGMFGRD